MCKFYRTAKNDRAVKFYCHVLITRKRYVCMCMCITLLYVHVYNTMIYYVYRKLTDG